MCLPTSNITRFHSHGTPTIPTTTETPSSQRLRALMASREIDGSPGRRQIACTSRIITRSHASEILLISLLQAPRSTQPYGGSPRPPAPIGATSMSALCARGLPPTTSRIEEKTQRPGGIGLSVPGYILVGSGMCACMHGVLL